jgi:hypothetical protein
MTRTARRLNLFESSPGRKIKPRRVQLEPNAVCALAYRESFKIQRIAKLLAMATNENVGTATVQSVTQSGFIISALQLPILKAAPIEEMTKNLGIQVPEMIFGDNYVRIQHIKSGWGVEFNAFDALDRVDKTGDKMLKVAYSKEWQDNR